MALLKADWNAPFIADMANFPASDRDHYTDAFCHALRAFVGTGADFKKPEWTYALPPAPEYEEPRRRAGLDNLDEEMYRLASGQPAFDSF